MKRRGANGARVKTAAASTNPLKVFDVRRPGKAPAHATSRPLIVGHKPQVQDPMMSEHDNTPAHEPLLNSRKKVTLKPTEETYGSQTSAANPPAPAPPVPKSIVPLGSEAKPAPAGASPDAAPNLNRPSPAPTAASPQTPEPQGAPNPQAAEAPQAPKPLTQRTLESMADLTPEDLAMLAMHDRVEATHASAADRAQLRAPTSTPQNSGVQSQMPASAPAGQMSANPAENPNSAGAALADAVTSAQPNADQPAPDDTPIRGEIFVSNHRRAGGHAFLWSIMILILAVVVIDLLLDAGAISTNLPHTHFLT